MRRAAFLLGPVVASVILFACEDDGSSSGGGVFSPDGATFETGGNTETGPQDGAVPDSAVAKPVTINVLRGAGVAAGVTVVFHDAAGAVLETKTTGADGKATSTPGVTPSQASVLLGNQSNHRILTWTAVEPGDDLFARDIGLSSVAGSFSVTVQGNFSDAGATSLNASAGTCTGTGPGPIQIFLSTDCVTASASILARAFDTIGDVIGYAIKKGGPPAATDGGVTDTAVGPWLAPSAITVTAQNRPASSFSFASFVDVSGGLAFENPTGGAISVVDNKAPFKVAPGFADAYQAGVRLTPNAIADARLTVAKRVVPASNIDIDFATALPTLNGTTVATTTPKRPQISWTTLASASLAGTDGGSIHISWGDNRDESNGWTFIVPPNATTVKAPAMPASADLYLPLAATDAGPASSYSEPSILFLESDLLPGYASFRREIGRVIPLAESSNRDARAVLPANGTLRMTSFRNEID